MTGADIQTGNPTIEGRYVTFIRCASKQASDWVEPIIMTWANEHWHTSFLKSKVIGWIGPLPVMKADDIEPMVYDL